MLGGRWAGGGIALNFLEQRGIIMMSRKQIGILDPTDSKKVRTARI
jgi:hypothetical protein